MLSLFFFTDLLFSFSQNFLLQEPKFYLGLVHGSRLRPFRYRYRIPVSVTVTVLGTVKVLNGTRYL